MESVVVMSVWKLTIILVVGTALAARESSWAQTPSEVPYSSPDLSPEKPISAPLNAGANSFAQGQARKLLESKGYSEVSSLVNGNDGIWRGSASKDGKTVDVSIDFQGNVAAR